MPISIGETLPSVSVHLMQDGKPTAVDTDELFRNRKVVLFALPGAFTPTCSAAHLPGFVVKADALKEKGVDAIMCLSVNDAFVMNAWGEQQNAEAITMLGDGSADFTEAVDLAIDLTERGMGLRSRRYAMFIENGVLKWLGLDEPGEFEKSSVEAVLEYLGNE